MILILQINFIENLVLFYNYKQDFIQVDSSKFLSHEQTIFMHLQIKPMFFEIITEEQNQQISTFKIKITQNLRLVCLF